MTVAELIEQLSAFPADLPVVVGGFDECGYDNLGTIEEVELAPIPRTSHGPDFEDTETVAQRKSGPSYNVIETTGPAFRALYLDR